MHLFHRFSCWCQTFCESHSVSWISKRIVLDPLQLPHKLTESKAKMPLYSPRSVDLPQKPSEAHRQGIPVKKANRFQHLNATKDELQSLLSPQRTPTVAEENSVELRGLRTAAWDIGRHVRWKFSFSFKAPCLLAEIGSMSFSHELQSDTSSLRLTTSFFHKSLRVAFSRLSISHSRRRRVGQLLRVQRKVGQSWKCEGEIKIYK